MTNKYGNAPFYENQTTGDRTDKRISKDDKYFASLWEREVYEEILKWIPKELVRHQHKVEIKPKTSVYPAMHITFDFIIVKNANSFNLGPGDVLLYVEAKGFATNDFKTRLKMFEYRFPGEYRKLAVVKNGPPYQSVDQSRLRTHNLETLQRVLARLSLT